MCNALCGGLRRLPTSPPQPQRPFVPAKLPALCKSPRASTRAQREAAPRFAESVPGRPLAAKTLLRRGGRSGLCCRQMFLFRAELGAAAPCAQMGASGEGAWGAVSRSNADGVSRTQFRWQTILMKRGVNLPQPGSFSGAFGRLPPPPLR